MLLIILIIIILFYIINNYLLNFEKREHFLTYYLPFYDKELNSLSNFYESNDNNKNYLKKKFLYDTIIMCSIKLDQYFITSLMSSYISNSNLINVNIKLNDNNIQNIIDLIDSKINCLITDLSAINYVNTILKINTSPIKLVTNLYRLYHFFITKKKYKVYSLNEIPPDFIIGLVDYPNPLYLYFFKLIKDLGYNIKTDFKIKKYKTYDSLFEGFIKSECNMIIICYIFPSKILNDFINENILEDIILLPFDIVNEDLFLKKNKNLYIDYIDLNKLSQLYLPKNFSKYTYNIYKPDFKVFYSNKSLVTNINIAEDRIYNFINFYYNNYKNINENISEGYKLRKTDMLNTYNELDFHNGVLKFFIEKGYISTNSNPNCKYLVGSLECNNKNLANNNLL